MLRIELADNIKADASRVWQVLSNVEIWPQWTASMSSVRRLDGGVFGVGSQVRIHQPRMMPAVWRVTAWNPGEGFVWESHAFGARVIAEHWIRPTSDGTVAELRVTIRGAMAYLLRPIIEPLTRRYMTMELAGLKKTSENVSPTSVRTS